MLKCVAISIVFTMTLYISGVVKSRVEMSGVEMSGLQCRACNVEGCNVGVWNFVG